MPENKSHPTAGLCELCTHARTVENPRGSSFTLCELSSSDPRFPKYPRLPVLACDGYRERTNAPRPSENSSS